MTAQKKSTRQEDPPPVRKSRRGFVYGEWQVRENVIASGKLFDNVQAWRKAHPGAYNSARQNGWVEAASAHMDRRTRWTPELLLADARQYGSPAKWKVASGSAYATARTGGLLDQCCAHMKRVRKPAHYWTREKCLESACRFQTIVEWTQEDSAAVDAAFRQGWYEEATDHMIEIVSFGEYCIRRLLMSYDIPFVCEKKYDDLKVTRHLRFDFFLADYNLLIEYHGEQHFLERKDYGERATLEEIQAYDKLKEEYAVKNGILLLTISSPNVATIEEQVVEKLKQIIASTKPALFLSMRRELSAAELCKLATDGRWTFEKVCEDALQYERYTEWSGTYGYQLALKRGWVQQASAHMERTTHGPGHWTFERLAEDARQYKSRKEWQKAPGAGYQVAYAKKLIEEAAPHLKPLRTKWTVAACHDSARQYASRKEWSNKAPNAYMAALRAGWTDVCCTHMEWKSTKPQAIYAAIGEGRTQRKPKE